jgi:hypothetical protein
MKQTYIHNLMSSFYLWLDHEILSRGEAFVNYSGKLYNSSDPNFPNSSTYSSPFRQWVYDSSISGVKIPSGVFINNTFLPKNTSGLAIDYNKGRIIFNNNLLNSNNITQQFSFKEFNLYYTDEREEKLLFEKAYSSVPKTNQITGGLGYLDIPYPCIFIKHRSSENNPFAFGGQDKTQTLLRCIALAPNSFLLDGLISILNDSSRKTFPLLSANDFPFNYLGDFKFNTFFDYLQLCGQIQDRIYIDRVTVSKLDEVENAKINKKVVAALIDFEVSDIRSPRISSFQLSPENGGEEPIIYNTRVINGGWSNSNGDYNFVADFNNKPYYEKGSLGLYFILYDNGWGVYDFSEESSPIYYSNSNTDYPWEATNWQINQDYISIASPVPNFYAL